MKTISEVYSSFNDARSAQKQFVVDLVALKLLLERCYKLLDSPDFEDMQIFGERANKIVNRITFERLISDLDHYSKHLKGNYSFRHQGLEECIKNLEVLDIVFSAPDRPGPIPIILKAQVYGISSTILSLSRTIVIEVKKRFIIEEVLKFEHKNRRINFLISQATSIKQNPNAYDETERSMLLDFIELEIAKWREYNESDEVHFKTNEELWRYLSNVMETSVRKSITLDGGYLNFWRDAACRDPKRETEIHQYIRTLFEQHCVSRNIKISKEPETANGNIDFTFTYLDFNVCLEVKKADHGDVEHAATGQLVKYMEGERTDFGLYLVIWHKSPGGFNKPSKYSSPTALYERIMSTGIPDHIKICVLDCSKPSSPSKQSPTGDQY